MTKQPLYPHIPGKKEPLFPHVPKGKETGIKTIDARGMPFPALNEIVRQYPAARYRQIGISYARDTTEQDIKEFRSSAIQSGAVVIVIQEYGQYAYVPLEQAETPLSPDTINYLAKTEGDPIRKFCCRQCGECAPPELLEEGRFPDRIAWLRSHYEEKHPGIWGKMEKLPQNLPVVTVICPICDKEIRIPAYNVVTRSDALREHLEKECSKTKADEKTIFPQVTIEGGDPVPPQYRHLIGWVSEPLPREAE